MDPQQTRNHTLTRPLQLLKDYDRQLEHLKKWVDDTKEEYDEWEATKQTRPAKR